MAPCLLALGGGGGFDRGLSSTPGPEQNMPHCSVPVPSDGGLGLPPVLADQRPPPSQPSATEAVTGHFHRCAWLLWEAEASFPVSLSGHRLPALLYTRNLLSTKLASCTRARAHTHARTDIHTHVHTHMGTEASQPQVQPLSSLAQKNSGRQELRVGVI